MKSDRPYEKHVYWLTREEEGLLREELARRKVRLKSAKGIVCTPLDRINKITSVGPEVWDETCNRQGSWYRGSEKNGLYLIVSSFDLGEYEDKKAAVIRESGFVPPRLASVEEKRRLCEERPPDIQVPPDWYHVGETEKRIYLRWARRFGSQAEDYDFLFLSHTANHLNFITPRFFIREQEEVIPYSIDATAHLCSCCVELFQVVGGEHRKKLVAPCPGGAIFARLRPDRYLLVQRPK